MKSLEEANGRLQENTILGPTATVFTNPPASTGVMDASDDFHSEIVIPSTSITSAVLDNRKGNRRISFRLRYTAIQKADAIIFLRIATQKLR